MLKSSPSPSNKLSMHAPLIHIMKVDPEKVNLIIGSGGKKVRSIIEESGVEAIDTQDDGTVKITAKNLSSLEKSKSLIGSLTMVPKVGDIYRDCEIKSVTPYGAFVEIAPGREGLCHISELSSGWLAKAEDAFKIGDRVDVKLIEVNDKGQLRLSRKVLLPDPTPEESSAKDDEEKKDQPKNKTTAPKLSPKSSKDQPSSVPQKKAYKRPVSPSKEVPDIALQKPKKSNIKNVSTSTSENASSLVNGEAKIG